MNYGGKPKKTTNFKKKPEKDDKVRACYVCGKEGHLAKNCRYRKDRDDGKPNKKVNVTIGNSDEAGGSQYGNYLVVFSVLQSTDWWVDTSANIHVCSDISLFTSYKGDRTSSVFMGNGSIAPVFGVGTVELKPSSGKTVRLKNVQHAPSINKNLISGSLLCRDGYKLVFESNKVVISKFGNFVGKGYDSGCLFLLNTVEPNFHLNIASMNKFFESIVWHSHFCHINFDTIARMPRLEFIPKLEVVKGSKCQSCVQAKQPRNPFQGFSGK
jgi:hypothetical protein